jgi:hypothetical protein
LKYGPGKGCFFPGALFWLLFWANKKVTKTGLYFVNVFKLMMIHSRHKLELLLDKYNQKNKKRLYHILSPTKKELQQKKATRNTDGSFYTRRVKIVYTTSF